MLSTYDRAMEALRASSDTNRSPDRTEIISTLKQIQAWSDAATPADTAAALSPPMLLPLCGGVAFGEGCLVLGPARSVTVHLGGEFFAQVSPEHAAGVLERRAAAEAAERAADDAIADVMCAADPLPAPTTTTNKTAAAKTIKKTQVFAAKRIDASSASFARGLERGFWADASPPAATMPAPASVNPLLAPDEAAALPLPPKFTTACGSKTQVEIVEGNDDDNKSAAEEQESDEDEGLEDDADLASGGLFEIEERVDAMGRVVSAKAVNMQTKIQATEGFRKLLVKASKGGGGEADEAAAALAADSRPAAEATARSKGGGAASELKARRPVARPQGAGSAKVPYAETAKALEVLMAAEEAASEQRDASEAARVQGITSPAWSKGFFSKAVHPAAPPQQHSRGPTDRPRPAGGSRSSISGSSSSAPEASVVLEALRRAPPTGQPRPMSLPVSRAPAAAQEPWLEPGPWEPSSEDPSSAEEKPMSKFKAERLARRERELHIQQRS
jgi:hypothetical protein